MAANWAERISAFSRRPSGFLSGTTAEAFLAELLRELRDDRATYSVKVNIVNVGIVSAGKHVECSQCVMFIVCSLISLWGVCTIVTDTKLAVFDSLHSQDSNQQTVLFGSFGIQRSLNNVKQ